MSVIRVWMLAVTTAVVLSGCGNMKGSGETDAQYQKRREAQTRGSLIGMPADCQYHRIESDYGVLHAVRCDRKQTTATKWRSGKTDAYGFWVED